MLWLPPLFCWYSSVTLSSEKENRCDISQSLPQSLVLDLDWLAAEHFAQPYPNAIQTVIQWNMQLLLNLKYALDIIILVFLMYEQINNQVSLSVWKVLRSVGIGKD